jgi:non-specific serine/threonine protein kinase
LLKDLYEMATTKQPFKGTTTGAIFDEILHKAPVSPVRINPDLPDDLEHIINKALEKDRVVRYQTTKDLLADLKRLKRDSGSGRAAVTPAAPSPLKGWDLRSWRTGVAGVGLIGLLILAFWYLDNFYTSKPKVLRTEKRSIAVLPLENLREDPEDEYYCNGLTIDIIAQLSKINGLDKVISRASVMHYKNSAKSIREIGRELDVSTILTGSVRRGSNLVRIDAELSDVMTGWILWTHSYDRKPDEIFSVQSEVALKIASELQVELGAEEKERLEKKPTENLTAYDFYLNNSSS